jgi:hypothetical protein
MYIRTATRTNRDGTRVSYLRLAHNVWDPEKGPARAQIIYNFGRADQVDREALKRLVRSICRFLSPEEELVETRPAHHGGGRGDGLGG